MLEKLKQEAIQGRSLLKFVALKATGEALAMVAPLLVAKFFSPSIFGSYSLAKMVVFLFVSMLISSTQAPFVVYAGKEQTCTGKINRTFTIQCVFLVVSLILFLAVVLTFSRFIMSFAQISKANLFFVYLAFVGVSVKTFLSNMFLAVDQKTRHALLELVFGICGVLLILIFRFFNWVNLTSVFLIYFLAAIFVIISFARYIEYSKLLPLAWDQKYFTDSLNFAKWVILGASSVYLINWGDNLVLRYFVSMDDIGIYNFAYSLFKGMTMLTFGLIYYFMPFVSKNINNKQSMNTYIFSKRPKAFLLGLAPICILFIFAPYAVRMAYNGIYDNSIAVLRILLVGSALALYCAFYAPLFHALERYRFSQSIDAVQALVNILLDLVFIPQIGMYGAAIATVIAYCCRTVILEIYFRKRIRKLFAI
jgi:O-antigen/teichoic acid export membrane protein